MGGFPELLDSSSCQCKGLHQFKALSANIKEDVVSHALGVHS